MKKITTSLLVLCSLIMFSFSLEKEDTKKIIKSEKIIEKTKNYQEAKEVLITLSDEGKKDVTYLKLASVVFDSCNNYTEAITVYNELLKIFPERNEFKTRIEELKILEAEHIEKNRIRLEIISKCTKCNGTDKLKIIEACEQCYGKGEAMISCSRCRGSGKVRCENCGGKGSLKTSEGYTVMDNVCGGAGSIPCSELCSKGLVLGTCKICRGKGNIEKIIKCDMHE